MRCLCALPYGYVLDDGLALDSAMRGGYTCNLAVVYG